MALTVSGYTQRNNCDAVGNWSAGATESDLYAEGAGSLKVKVSQTTSSVIDYDFGSDQNFSGLHMGIFLFVAGTFNTKSAGGVTLIARDNSGNYKRWYVGGSDVYYLGRNGFQLFTIDLENTNPDESSGTLSASAIRYLGFRVDVTSKAIKENVFWDNLFTFSALTVTTTSTEEMTISDLKDWANTNENALFVEAGENFYLARTGVILGSTTAGLHIDFKTTGETLQFENRTVGDGGTAISSSLYQWKLQGNSTGTIQYETGSKSGTSGIQGLRIIDTTGTAEVDFNDSNIDTLKIYGGTFAGVNTIDFPSLTGANYECLTTVFEDHGVITPRTFKIEGSWYSINATSWAFAFASLTHNIKDGTIINPTSGGWDISTTGSIAANNVKIVGTDGSTNYDVRNSNNSSNEDSNANGGSTYNLNDTNKGFGQSFTGGGNVLTNVVLSLKKTNTPTGNAYAKIYAHSGTYGSSSVPTGTALATSEALDVSTLGGTFADVKFDFLGASNQITLSNGVNYVVTIEYANGTSSNTVDVEYDASNNHGGNSSTYTTSWSANGSTDLEFYVRVGGLVIVNLTNGASMQYETNTGSPAGVTDFVASVNVTLTNVVSGSSFYMWATAAPLGNGTAILGPLSITTDPYVQAVPYTSDQPMKFNIAYASTPGSEKEPIQITGTITSDGYTRRIDQIDD